MTPPRTRGTPIGRGRVEIYHVVPVEDWMAHEERGDACVCGPHVEYFSDGIVVVHHALDGRNSADHRGPGGGPLKWPASISRPTSRPD